MSSNRLSKSDIRELLETARDHFREGHYQVCESLLEQLLISDAQNPEIYHMMATIYYDKGKFNKAIKTFRRALEIDPCYTDSSVGLSIILNDLGRYDEAKVVFNDAQNNLAKRSNSPDPYMQERLATKHDELGELYFQYRRYRESMEQYQRALELSSRKAELKMKFIECLLKLSEDSKALQELRLLVQEYPQFIPARLKLGTVLYNFGQSVEAIEQWESVLLRDPDHPVATKYLQMAQEGSEPLHRTSAQL